MRTGALLAERYRLDRPIAAGGMGQVWRATDEVLQRQVAVKLLRPEHAHHLETLYRFRSEARHAASLTHPCIAQVHDYGDTGSHGSPYLVMELVDGPSLGTMLADGPVSPAYAMDVISQVASGLAAAHRVGLIHRDIKPANILLGPDGQVKITDFGIAHVPGSSAPLTGPGMMMGTSQYVAPERIEGRPASPASDLYSLGIVLYECLTGVPPFNGTPGEVMASHLHRPVPPLPPEVPPEVRDLAARLTAKDPAERLADAGELAAIAHQLHTDLAAGRPSPQRQTVPAEPGRSTHTATIANGRRPASPVAAGPVAAGPVASSRPEPAPAGWKRAAPSAPGRDSVGFLVNPSGVRPRRAGRKYIWVPSACQHLKADLTAGKARLVAGKAALIAGMLSAGKATLSAGQATLSAGKATLSAGAGLLAGAARPTRGRRRARWAAVLAVLLVAVGFAGREIFEGMQHGDPQSTPAALSNPRPAAPSRVLPTASPVPSTAVTPSQAATPSAAASQAATPPPAPGRAAAPPAAKPAVKRLTPKRAMSFGTVGVRNGDTPGTANRALRPGTGWLSQWYATAAFGHLKKGTGLLVDMGSVVSITSLSARLGRMRGATIELKVGDRQVMAALHTVKRVANAGGRVVLRFPAVKARYILIWYTKLPPDGSGTYQANVANVVVHGYR